MSCSRLWIRVPGRLIIGAWFLLFWQIRLGVRERALGMGDAGEFVVCARDCTMND